jgi:hypothetical protein
MSIPAKISVALAAAIAFLLALMGGLYLSGWLTLLLLHLRGQVDLDANTFWQYWRVRDLPRFSPYATQIKIAGGIGLGLPLLLWVGALALLFKFVVAPMREAARWNRPASPEPAAQTSNEQTQPESSASALLREHMMRQAQLVHEQSTRQPGTPPLEQPSDAPEPNQPDTFPTQPPRRQEQARRPFHEQFKEDMNLKQMAATAVLATAAVGAVATDTGHSKADRLPKFNPHPKEIYEITLTVHDAPGPMEQGGVFVAYRANNIQCVPDSLLRHNGTSPTIYSANTDLEHLSKTDDKKYKTVVALDLLVDGDYYKKGMCHWEVHDVNFGVMRFPEKSDPIVLFDSVIQQSDIEAGHTVTTYFLKSDYNDPEHQTIGPAGSVKQFTEQDYLNTPAVERSVKFFFVTLTAKKIKPQPDLQRLIRRMYWPPKD